MKSENLISVYEISKKIVKECFPDDLVCFEDLWDALEPAFSGSGGAELEVRSQRETAVYFAPNKLHLLELPSSSVIECVRSAVLYYANHGECPSASEFKNLVTETLYRDHNYSKKEAESLSEVAWRLLVADLSRIYPAQIKKQVRVPTFTKSFLIWESGKPLRDGTEKDIERLREAAKQGKFDIFANDAKSGELLVFSQPSRLRIGETFAWIVLTTLLESVGSRWTHEELFRKIHPDKEYKRDIHSSQVYHVVRHVKEVLADDIDKSGRKVAPDLVDRWFNTKQPNRVEVSLEVRACFIRRNLAANS